MIRATSDSAWIPGEWCCGCQPAVHDRDQGAGAKRPTARKIPRVITRAMATVATSGMRNSLGSEAGGQAEPLRRHDGTRRARRTGPPVRAQPIAVLTARIRAIAEQQQIGFAELALAHGVVHAAPPGESPCRAPGRRRGHPRRPPTPPYVRFRIRRFTKPSASGDAVREDSPVHARQGSASATPRSCAKLPRSTRVRARWKLTTKRDPPRGRPYQLLRARARPLPLPHCTQRNRRRIHSSVGRTSPRPPHAGSSWTSRSAAAVVPRSAPSSSALALA